MSADTTERAREYLDDWFGLGQWPPVHCFVELLTGFAQSEREAALRRVAKGLVPLYRKDQVEIARLCDEELDRTGNLLGWLREEAALASAPQEQPL